MNEEPTDNLATPDPPAKTPPDDHAGFERIGWLKRRGLALLLPVVCVASGALFPSVVDIYKLWMREPGVTWLQVLHSAVFILSLNSMVSMAAGLAVGILLLVLTRNRDLAQSASLVSRRIIEGFKKHNARPEAAALTLAVPLGLAVVVGLSYKITLAAFSTFKNIQLAALLLACLYLGVVVVGLLAVAVFRVGLILFFRGLRRIPGIRVAGTVTGSLVLTLLAVAAAILVLVFKYRPIVRIIDWRPLSYPSLMLAGGLVLLCFVLWRRSRRILAGRRPGILRRAGLGVWCAVLLGLWSYCLVDMENRTSLRTLILRRSFGAARSMDIMAKMLDFDSDGYLSFFGGGDCAPFNAGVNPGAAEIPGNGIDDNCFGGDLSLKALNAPARSFAHPLPPKISKQKLNFVFITLDGLRADHVGVYGYKKPTTPHIDHLARRSVVFERAITQAPSTRYSIPSFLSSKYSSQVPRKSVTSIPKPILPELTLMAEVFKKAGYRTGAALSYMVFNKSWNLDQGFDFYDNTHAAYYVGKGSPRWKKDQPYKLVDTAKKFLDSTGSSPFFLWVHFFEPHPPFVHRKKPRDFGSDTVGTYDGELCFVDQKVSDLLEAIKRHPGGERTVIAISSDHGRGLGEHGLATHGYDLYVENLHVPLIMYVPGLTHRRIKNPVALLDILPTFVNLAQLKDRFDFEGESLVPQLVEGVEPDPRRPIFSEVQVGFHNSHVINAITTRDFRLIYDVTYNTYQLFDHRVDPQEKVDVADKHPEDLKRLKGSLFKVMERATLPAIQEEINSSVVKKVPIMPGIQQVNFGNQVQFLGFEVHPKRPVAGGILQISWYIKALSKIKNDNKVLIHLKGSKGAFFDAKHVPVRGQYPMTKWTPGQIIRDRQHMRLQSVPQEYEVWVGFGTGHDILKPVKRMKMVHTVVNVGKFSTY